MAEVTLVKGKQQPEQFLMFKAQRSLFNVQGKKRLFLRSKHMIFILCLHFSFPVSIVFSNGKISHLRFGNMQATCQNKPYQSLHHIRRFRRI